MGVNVAARHSLVSRISCVVGRCPGLSLCGHPSELAIVHMSSVRMTEAAADACPQPLGRIIARVSAGCEPGHIRQKVTLPSLAGWLDRCICLGVEGTEPGWRTDSPASSFM
jgi:hypothetical protein